MATNKAMRLGSAMLVLALITTCAIATTFAKYTTSATGNDTARVAYWGFANSTGKLDSSTTGLELFKTFYAKDDSTLSDSGIVNTVNTAGTDKLVAPGTTNSVAVQFKYKSYAGSDASTKPTAPEVAYKMEVTVVASDKAGTGAADVAALDANPDFKWTLQKNSGDATEYDKLKDLLAAIASWSGETVTATDLTTDGPTTVTGTKNVAANTLPTAFVDSDGDVTYTIGWKWAFENATEASKAGQDIADTNMGNGYETYKDDALVDITDNSFTADLDDLKLSITITATQID